MKNGARLELAFSSGPLWPAIVVGQEIHGIRHSGSYVLKIRRPTSAIATPFLERRKFDITESAETTTAFLVLDPGVGPARRRVEGINKLLLGHEPQLAERLLQDIILGRGFTSLINLAPNTVAGALLERFRFLTLADLVEKQHTTPLPTRPIMSGRRGFTSQVDSKYFQAVLSMVKSHDRERYCKYLDLTIFGLVVISGFAGSGKTELLALTTLLFLEHKEIGKVYATGPSNTDTSNFAQRLDKLGREVTSKYNQNDPEVTRSCPCVVRGFDLEDEVDIFADLVDRLSSNIRLDP